MWKRREAKAVYSPRRYHIARYVASSQEELTWLKKASSAVPGPPSSRPPPPSPRVAHCPDCATWFQVRTTAAEPLVGGNTARRATRAR